MPRCLCWLFCTVTAFAADWPYYGGGPDQMRYSPLTQITRENVGRLQPAWTYDTGDAFPGSEMQCQPVVAHGVLYATSPKLRVFALDAATGALKWSFEPNKDAKNPTRTRIRGLMYWERGDARRIYFGARHWLYALDARTGEPVAGFGQDGRIDLREGFAGRDPRTLNVGVNTPGVFYGDLLILGSIVPEGLPSAPGDIRAFNVDTGRQQWAFHTIPHPGELGYDTWPKDAWRYSGGANAWSGVALDEKRGLVYASTGSAAYDFYGANRHGDNLFANTILCLRAATGERVWHFQGVKHDIWDRDFPAPPSLVTITRDGAASTSSRRSRRTGGPTCSIARRADRSSRWRRSKAPASDVPGERASATQVLPTLPPPFTRQRFTEDLITTRTPAAHAAVREAVADAAQGRRVRPAKPAGHHPVSRHGRRRRVGRHRVRPGLGPAVRQRQRDGVDGEAGRAQDAGRRAGDAARCSTSATARRAIARTCGATRRSSRRSSASARAAASTRSPTIVREGGGRMPGYKQLHGAVRRAIVRVRRERTLGDASSGQAVALRRALHARRRHPLHRSRRLPRHHAALGHADRHRPEQGGHRVAGAARRGAWLGPRRIPAARTTAARSSPPAASSSSARPTTTSKFRAFDAATGKVLWETTLPAAGNATPAVYEVDGRQYVVIAAGGGKWGAPSGGSYVAFALP